MKRFLYLVPFIAIPVLQGCGKQEVVSHTSATPQEVIAEPPPKPAYSNEDWRRDFTSAFVQSNEKTDSEGITNYRACFLPSGEKCGIFLSGMKDGFRKVDHLTPPMTAWHETSVKYTTKSGSALIDMRVVAQQCTEAVAVLNPTLHAKSWLFMNKVAFMADGDVVYEQDAPSQGVKRDAEDGRVMENWSLKLEPVDYEKLQKFATAKSQVIRVTGDKGYTTLSKESVDVFSKDVILMINATKLINEALVKNGGPNCMPDQ